ncbi:MAG: hypothetical protein VX939_12030 [Pseudomonadota bacterium]|nr:hypothetical protein [Pseudomonadota bacterium]
MLLFTAAVSEAQVNPFDFVFFDQINRFGHCACSVSDDMFVVPDQSSELKPDRFSGQGSISEAWVLYLGNSADNDKASGLPVFRFCARTAQDQGVGAIVAHNNEVRCPAPHQI